MSEQAILSRRPDYPATDDSWWRWIADLCYARKEHVPRRWEIEYEDGADGCLPAGWYAIGVDYLGLLVDWPMRHEYGPFDLREEAEAHSTAVIRELSKE